MNITKKVDKWSTTLEIAEQIYTNVTENSCYSCEDANNDFDWCTYNVLHCALAIVDVRLCLEGKDEMLPWSE